MCSPLGGNSYTWLRLSKSCDYTNPKEIVTSGIGTTRYFCCEIPQVQGRPVFSIQWQLVHPALIPQIQDDLSSPLSGNSSTGPSFRKTKVTVFFVCRVYSTRQEGCRLGIGCKLMVIKALVRTAKIVNKFPNWTNQRREHLTGRLWGEKVPTDQER